MKNPDGRPRILYAEDDRTLSDTIGDILEEVGFSVVLASDGVAALERASERDFDVLLTDLDMPRMNGIQLVEAMRRKEPGLPVVVLSGNPPPGGFDAFAGMGTGPLALLSKPVRLACIERALLEVMEAADMDRRAGR